MKLKAVREGSKGVINITNDVTHEIIALYSDEFNKKFSIVFTYVNVNDMVKRSTYPMIFNFTVRESDKRFTQEQAQIMLEEVLKFQNSPEEDAPNEELMNEKVHAIMEAVLKQVNIQYDGAQKFAVIIKNSEQMKDDIKKIISRE